MIVDKFYNKIQTDNAQYYFYAMFCEEIYKGQMLQEVEIHDIQEYFGADPLEALKE